MNSVRNIYVASAEVADFASRDTRYASWLLDHNRNITGVDFCDDPDRADKIIVFEEFSFKQPCYAERLLQSDFFRRFAEKIFVINYDDVGQGFLRGAYTSLEPRNFIAHMHTACAYPKEYNTQLSVANGSQYTPGYLYSFVGNASSHKVRGRLCSALAKDPRGLVENVGTHFHLHSDVEKLTYAEKLLQGKFVLCPRGQSPATYRMFEAMKVGRCPVIISDDWIPIEGVDWEACSIRISEEDVGRVPHLLRERESEWESLGNRAGLEYDGHFSEAARFRFYARSAIQSRGISGGYSVDFYRKFWSSYRFRWGNRWTISQRAFRKLRSVWD